MMNPSTCTDEYWIEYINKDIDYPWHTRNGGKWLIFCHKDKIDEVWQKVITLIDEGKLGMAAKVSTKLGREEGYSKDKDTHCICVYTYDYKDKKDVFRVRETLKEELGIEEKIYYKTDYATMYGGYPTYKK